MNQKKPPEEKLGEGEKISLAPLKLREALKGILAIPNPEATKPKHEKAKRKKAPPTNKG